jgi:hypothetical protein
VNYSWRGKAEKREWKRCGVRGREVASGVEVVGRKRRKEEARPSRDEIIGYYCCGGLCGL